MVTILEKTEEVTKEKIKAGTLAAANHAVFENDYEAVEYGVSKYGVGKFLIAELCDCTVDMVKDEPTAKFPNQKRLLKPVEIKQIKLG